MFRLLDALLEALREEDQEGHLEQELHQEEEDLHWKHLHQHEHHQSTPMHQHSLEGPEVQEGQVAMQPGLGSSHEEEEEAHEDHHALDRPPDASRDPTPHVAAPKRRGHHLPAAPTRATDDHCGQALVGRAEVHDDLLTPAAAVLRGPCLAVPTEGLPPGWSRATPAAEGHEEVGDSAS